MASQLAAGSGEALQDAMDKDTALVERHAELGETFVWFAFAFFLAVLALMVWDTMQRRRAAAAGEEPICTSSGGREPRSCSRSW